jgi:N utilization substance protein B
VPATDVLAATRDRRIDEGQPALNPYVAQLVDGVVAHQSHIDELLGSYSMGWTLDRMPAVDLAILRIGAYEVLWRDDVPDAVAIAEAVQLAQELSTDESSSFVNGLLGRILELKPRLAIEADAQPEPV